MGSVGDRDNLCNHDLQGKPNYDFAMGIHAKIMNSKLPGPGRETHLSGTIIS